MNSNVQITALKKEFQDGQTGFEVKVEGMEGKLDLAMNFRDPLKAMKYSFLLAKRLDLQIDKIQLAAMSMAYQRAKEAMNRAVEDATSAATELGQSEEPSVEDSAPVVAEEPEEPVAMSAFEESASPILKQYQELKKKHPDSMLLFRCGDFYESYDDDAQKISEVLGITLTRRSSDNTRMAGFPYHALDTYLPKLIRSGIRVAICDQLEEKPQPKKRGRKPKVQEPELNIEPAE